MPTPTPKRIDWSKDETILAMDLYSRISFGQCNQTNKFVRLLAERIGRTPGAVARKLGNLARLDPTLRSRGIMGLGHGSKMDEIVWTQAHANWEEFLDETLAARSRLGLQPTLIPEPSSEPIITERISSLRTRVGQQFFRAAVLASYRSKCCMCNLDDCNFIVASHIRPWSVDVANRLNPRNGIALCVLHDAAFDGFSLSLDLEFRWIFSKLLKERFTRAPYDKFFAPYEGQRLNFPDRWSPEVGFINWHRSRCLESDSATSPPTATRRKQKHKTVAAASNQ